MNGQAKWRTALLPSAVIAGAASVALWSGAASADSNVIQACVNDTNGNVRIVSGPGQCRQHENPLSWNMQGPPGETGPMGPAGAQGPPGMSDLERVEFSSANDAAMRKNAFAKCPDGTQVVGGGAQVFTSGVIGGPIAITKSFPDQNMDGWAATAEVMGSIPAGQTWFLDAYAQCAKVASSASQ
jgi:hypothetical protein